MGGDNLCHQAILVDDAACTITPPRPELILRRPPRTGRRLIRSRERSGDRVIGPRRAEFPAAMGSSSVVVALVLGHHDAQVSFAEDQHPVGHLRPGGEHKPFGISVRLWVPRTSST